MNPQFNQTQGSTSVQTNKQILARKFGVNVKQVAYFKSGLVLDGYKVIYDKSTERAYSLPNNIAPGTIATGLNSAGVLVWSGGSVDLADLAVQREEFVTLDGSFATGQTLNIKNEALTDTSGRYIWKGAFPKVVVPGSTPANSGGIGDTAWASVSDKMVRVWVKSNIGISDTIADLSENLINVGAAIIHGTHEVPSTGLAIPRECVLSATGQAISFSGNIKHSKGYFHKTGNATIFLEPASGELPNQTIDTVLYIDPARTVDNIYSQKTTIENIAIQGDASSPNECGIFVLQGGGYTLRDIDVAGCKYGFYSVDMWVTSIERFTTDGAIQLLGGTSTTLINCAVKGRAGVRGAIHIENLNYSALVGCSSDNAPDGAYYFKGGNAISLVGCGAESAKVVSPNTGLGLTLDEGVNGIIDGFLYRPRTNDSQPIVVVAANVHVKINNFITNVGVVYTSADIYVYGNDSVIEVSQGRFRLGATVPKIHIEPGCTGKVVVKLEGGNTAVFTAGVTKETPTVEYEFLSGTFNPVLTINGSSGAISYASRSGNFSKSGNMVTVNFTLTLSSKGGGAGNVAVGNLPYPMPANSGGVLFNYSNVLNGPLVLGSPSGGMEIFVRRLAATGTGIITNADINNDTVLSGSITYAITNSAFNQIPV